MNTTAARTDLNNDNSRELGIGERIEVGIFRQDDIEIGFWLEIDSNYPLCGAMVEGSDPSFYRRLLPDMATFSTGANRTKQEGRGRFDLIPYEAMLALAQRLELGSLTYGDRNWEKGMPLSRYLSSLRRHAMQVSYDFTEDHLGAVLFNAAAFVATASRIKAGILPKELDDIGYLSHSS